MLEQLRKDVLATAIGMLEAGLVEGSDGNVSAKDPLSGHIAITPSGLHYDKITPDDIVIVDINRNVLWGSRTPSSETGGHCYIHQHRKDVFAVMHTHSYYATVFAIAGRELPPATMGLAAHFGGIIRCAPWTRTGSEAVGPSMVETLGEHGKAILMKNHGALCVAPSLKKVLSLAIALEQSAKLLYDATVIGEPTAIPDEDVRWLSDLVASFEAKDAQPKVG